MINKEIPFRPRLEGEFRVRFYNAVSVITDSTPTLTIAKIADGEINWVENECTYNIEQRKKIPCCLAAFSRSDKGILESLLSRWCALHELTEPQWK